MQEGELIDFGNAPEIYADDIGNAEAIGSTFRTIYCAWKRMPGSQIFSRVVVATIVRPMTSFTRGKVADFLAQQNNAKAMFDQRH